MDAGKKPKVYCQDARKKTNRQHAVFYSDPTSASWAQVVLVSAAQVVFSAFFGFQRLFHLDSLGWDLSRQESRKCHKTTTGKPSPNERDESRAQTRGNKGSDIPADAEMKRSESGEDDVKRSETEKTPKPETT